MYAQKAVAVQTATAFPVFQQRLNRADRAIIDEDDEVIYVLSKPGHGGILGATMVARHTEEGISEPTAAMTHRLRLKHLSSVTHRYPTQCEAIKKVADAYNRSRLTPFVQRFSAGGSDGSHEVTMIDIDGSFGEGGGQIIRSSLALALLTGQSFRLSRIRAGRPKPGLQPQHLMSVRSAATIGNATVTGDKPGSSVLTFEPGEVRTGNYRFAIGTAGATSLVLHTLYLPLALRGGATSELTLEGGTHVIKSPCYQFLQETWREHLERIGLPITTSMNRPGFYPRGGGQVRAIIQPTTGIQPLKMTNRPPLTHAQILSVVADVPDHVAKRQARRLRERLARHGIEADFELQEWGNGPASVVGVRFPEMPVSPWFFALGERGKPAEAVADDAADEAIAYLATDAPIDEHSADQLLLPLVFAAGESEFRVSKISLHLTTNANVIRQFLDRDIEIVGDEGQPGLVRIRGRGL